MIVLLKTSLIKNKDCFLYNQSLCYQKKVLLNPILLKTKFDYFIKNKVYVLCTNFYGNKNNDCFIEKELLMMKQ